jgi:cytochrome c oxidase subunit IV
MTPLLDRTVQRYLDTASIRDVTASIGILVTALLIAILCEREVVSAALAHWRRARLAAVDAVVVPLVVTFVVIVVARFQGLRL